MLFQIIINNFKGLWQRDKMRQNKAAIRFVSGVSNQMKIGLNHINTERDIKILNSVCLYFLESCYMSIGTSVLTLQCGIFDYDMY